jgi:hypothetical protein
MDLRDTDNDQGEAEVEESKHFITLEELVAADDREYRDEEVPEWGGWVTLKSLTKQEQLDIREQAIIDGEIDVGRVELLALTACIVKPEMTTEQIGVMRGKNAAVVNRLIKVVAVLAGLNEEEEQTEAKAEFREGAEQEV